MDSLLDRCFEAVDADLVASLFTGDLDLDCGHSASAFELDAHDSPTVPFLRFSHLTLCSRSLVALALKWVLSL